MSTVPQTSPMQMSPSQLLRAATQQWRQFMVQQLGELRVSIPAFLVQDMDVNAETVIVQIAVQERVRTLLGEQWWDLPPVFHVPVVLPKGGGFALTLPLKKGDEGLLVFCDGCFDLWWQNGTQNAPLADNSTQASGSQRNLGNHKHEFWDCGFFPGMNSQPNLIPNYSSTACQLRSLDGDLVISLEPGQIDIHAPAVNIENGGTPQALLTDAFLQYFNNDILPFLQSKGYTGPNPPSNSETTVLKGQ